MQIRKPFLLISLTSLVVGISVSIVKFGSEPHIAMLVGVLIASIVAWRCGYAWRSIQDGMIQGITNSLQAVIILVIIGILIGVWIVSGLGFPLPLVAGAVLSGAYFGDKMSPLSDTTNMTPAMVYD